MAAEAVVVVPVSEEEKKTQDPSLSTYLGLSFAIFLGFFPKSSISLVSSLQSRNRALSFKLIQAEEQLKQMKSRRKEDSKANARVVEIFASHRNGWQQEERKLLQQIEGSAEEIAHLREKIDEFEKTESELRVCLEKLQREVEEREEMINFMSRQGDDEDEEEEVEGDDGGDEEYGVGSIEGGEMEKEEVGDGMYHSQIRGCYGRSYQEANGDHCGGGNLSRFGNIRVSEGLDPISEECYMYRNGDEMPVPYGQHNNGFTQKFVSPAPTVCSEKTGGWQDTRYDSVESMYHMKQFAARRESPWKVHGEATGVPSKLKLLEQELLNLERNDIGGDQSKVPSLMRKQAKRYQSLAGKIDDLCKRMSSDPCEQNLTAEFRTRRQTEFLMEAYRLQQRAIETRQKLTTLQTETAKSHFTEDLSTHSKLTTRRSLDSVKNNFREIQRNLEVWLARIMGDLEGVLSRDGASRVKEYYISRNPFVQ